MRILYIAGILLAASVAFVITAGKATRAQDTSPYDNTEIDIDDDVMWLNIGVSLMRDPDLPPENFIVNLSIADRYTTGCPPVKDMEYETEFKDESFNIKMPKLVIDNEKFPYYDCNGKPRNPKADIVLNRNELEEKGIEKISIVNGPITKTYMIHFSDEKVELEVEDKCKAKSGSSGPKNMNEGASHGCGSKDIKSVRMQSVNNLKNPLRLWFYPEGTLLLYTPDDSKMDPRKVKESLRSFAIGMGLTPLEDIYTNFKSPLVKNEYSYFVDKSGAIVGGGKLDGSVIGNISVERMAYGLHGDEPVTEQIPVYARRPGAYD